MKTVNVKVNVKNIDKVKRLVDEVEKGCKARLFSIDRLKDLSKVEDKLKELGIPKKFWEGIFVEFQPESVPRSYKYRAEGTFVIVKRFKSGWFVTSVVRGYCREEPYGGDVTDKLYITEEAKKAIPSEYQL